MAVIWVCDRCQVAGGECVDDRRMPLGWVLRDLPTRANRRGTRAKTAEVALCGACDDALREWLYAARPGTEATSDTPEPLLGLATTAEMLNEVSVRLGMALYDESYSVTDRDQILWAKNAIDHAAVRLPELVLVYRTADA